MSKRVTITDAAAEVLKQATVDGRVLKLPPGQLERQVYVEIDKAIKAMGGKWNRSAGGHVFAEHVDIDRRLREGLGDGVVISAKAFGFFPTPEPIVDRLMELARVETGHLCLEPSAGQGAIADRLAAIVEDPVLLVLVELLEDNVKVLEAKGYTVHHDDFLKLGTPELGGNFDRIVMNPPFERGADRKHVMHAYDLLRPGGRLVSVMAGETKLPLSAPVGTVIRLGRGAFHSSGTQVDTMIIVLDKPQAG